jgi:NAD(P)-dependent dehydrogenase (short-subunit alcohol dehydrogenase family)
MGIPDEVFDKMMATNIKSNMWLSHMCIPSMEARGGGAIVIISSIGGTAARSISAPMRSRRRRTCSWRRNLACDGGPKNIRVNCIAPGSSGPTSPGRSGRIRRTTRSGRGTRREADRGADEIAGQRIPRLAGGSFMTGQSIVIDGGVTCGVPANAED